MRAIKLRQGSAPARGRVAHVVAAPAVWIQGCGGDDEEAVEGGVEREVLRAWVGASDHRPELAIRRVTAEDDEAGVAGGL